MDLLHFLNKTVPGRIFLKPLSSRFVSKLCGVFLDSRCSAFLIKSFAHKNKINLEDYETQGIKPSMNFSDVK